MYLQHYSKAVYFILAQAAATEEVAVNYTENVLEYRRRQRGRFWTPFLC